MHDLLPEPKGRLQQLWSQGLLQAVRGLPGPGAQEWPLRFLPRCPVSPCLDVRITWTAFCSCAPQTLLLSSHTLGMTP